MHLNICAVLNIETCFKLLYILESNPHPFYSFRGLKNEMRIRIECGLDSQSRAASDLDGFFGCTTQAIRVFENRVLRRIFGP
jgi:hypothetical protein